jgi:hypothetical protein
LAAQVAEHALRHVTDVQSALAEVGVRHFLEGLHAAADDAIVGVFGTVEILPDSTLDLVVDRAVIQEHEVHLEDLPRAGVILGVQLGDEPLQL